MKKLLLSVALLFTSATTASELMEAHLLSLSQHPMWLELLHYEPSFWGQSRSAIKSSEFFLAANGRENALAELKATLHALAQPSDRDPDQHAYCRFPARAQWLENQLGEKISAQQPKCTALDNWSEQNDINSVSVIYATGFLGNPASYYGHTLLKFNTVGSENLTPSELLDVSINYGAILEGRTDPLSYIVKGIFGGYDGGFSQIGYYFHNHNYGETELRDLWEYPLELSPDDTRLIVNHAWEVLGMRYTYYFFRRNCAFRMAELLEMAEQVDIIPANRPWTIPQSVIQSFDSAKKDSPVTSEVRYHPSRQSRLHHRFQQLSVAEQSILEKVIADSTLLNSADFDTLPLTSQYAIIDTALDYYQFALRSKAGEPSLLESEYRQALSKRYQLPAGAGTFDMPSPESPHAGRNPGWFQLSLGYNQSGTPFSQVRVRAAYYDALDGGSGHVPDAALTMGDLTLKVTKDRLAIRDLTLFAIESLNPGITGLPGDDGSMWNLGAGLHSLRLDCENCLAARVHGDLGTATRLSDHWVASMYLGGALQDNRMGYGNGFVQLGGRAIYRNGSWSGRMSYELRSPIRAERSGFSVIRLELRRSLSVNQDVRLLLEHNGGKQLSAGLGWYW